MKGYNKKTGLLNPKNALFDVRLKSEGHRNNYLAIQHESFHDNDDEVEIRDIDDVNFNKYFIEVSECLFMLNEDGERTFTNKKSISDFCISLGMVEDENID